MTSTATPLKVLIVDDEPLARHWLRMQLGKCQLPVEISEVASAALATQWLEKNECHVLLLDIHMPGTDGLEFANQCQSVFPGLAIIFVTADSNHALQAFDYLTKPVNTERLEKALQRVRERAHLLPVVPEENLDEPAIIATDHQQIVRIPLSRVLYFQADSKYVKVATENKSYLIEDSLQMLEEQFTERVIRVHRSYLVPVHAIESLKRSLAASTAMPSESWCLKLHGTDELLPISRRQLPQARALLQHSP